VDNFPPKITSPGLVARILNTDVASGILRKLRDPDS